MKKIRKLLEFVLFCSVWCLVISLCYLLSNYKLKKDQINKITSMGFNIKKAWQLMWELLSGEELSHRNEYKVFLWIKDYVISMQILESTLLQLK